MCNYIISGNLPEQKDVWFIGDEFLRDSFYTYKSIGRQPGTENSGRIPYLFDYYNVSTYMMNRNCRVRSCIACIQNSLVTELNRNMLTILPCFIIIMPDWDILKSDNFYNYGIKELCNANVHWLVNEIDRVVSTKKEDMFQSRKGSICISEPKIIYTKMIYRPTKSSAVAA